MKSRGLPPLLPSATAYPLPPSEQHALLLACPLNVGSLKLFSLKSVFPYSSHRNLLYSVNLGVVRCVVS